MSQLLSLNLLKTLIKPYSTACSHVEKYISYKVAVQRICTFDIKCIRRIHSFTQRRFYATTGSNALLLMRQETEETSLLANFVSWSKENYGSEDRRVFLISSSLLTFLGLGKKDESEQESELIMTIKRGVLLMQQGELKKSEQMLHIALKIAQEQQNSEAITYIYDLLANVAYEAHNWPKAEKLFVSVLQRIISTGTAESDNKTLHISLKLASIYKEKGEDLKAEEGFKFCKQHLQKKIDAGEQDEHTLLLWAMTLDWYARFCLDKRQYDESFALFKKAFETNVKVNGLVHEQNVVLLNDLGTVCCLQNNYDEAIKHLTEAVNISKQLPEMEDAASVYINLGTVYLKKQMLYEAKNACKEGWRNAKLMKNVEAINEANICLDEVKTKLSA